MRGFAYISIVTIMAGAALGQSGETLPAIEIADVQAVGRRITNVGSALPAVLCFSCVSLCLRARLAEPSDASIIVVARLFTAQPVVRPSLERGLQIVQQDSADSPPWKK
jgi:hypothetical protein